MPAKMAMLARTSSTDATVTSGLRLRPTTGSWY
jgi:hypothetical protein